MSNLFTPLRIREVQLRNRIVVSPMCQYSSADGFANDWHLVHLGSRATGGAGMVIQEATAVSAEGRISPGDAGLYRDEHIDKWRSVVSFIKQQGAIAAIQLAHAGRKASCRVPWEGGKQISIHDGGWLMVAPSAIPFYDKDEAPEALDSEGIRKVTNDFRNAAERALQAGYQVIEVHAAHGYLIHSFLSPLSNHRTDQYGGIFENRIRLLLEVVSAIRSVWPAHLPLFVRISCTDWAAGGWNEGESVQLSEILTRYEVDLIDCSSGGLVPGVKIPVGPGYQVPFAEKIKKSTSMMTGAVGMITSASQAEDILQKGSADLVIMARELLRDPYFPLHAAKLLGAEITWPEQYGRAKL